MNKGTKILYFKRRSKPKKNKNCSIAVFLICAIYYNQCNQCNQCYFKEIPPLFL